jgi:hypothetical protein
MAESTIKRKRKREEIYEESLYINGESVFIQILRFLWRLLIAPFAWSWRQFMRLMAASWRMTKAALGWSLRSSWQMLAWIFRIAKDTTVWTVKLPLRAFSWSWQAVFGPPVRYSNPRYAEIHALITRRYRRRRRFITHLFIFIVTNIIMWLDWWFEHPVYYFYPQHPFNSTPLLLTVIWTVILVFHFVRMRHGVEEDVAIEQAIEREREWELLRREYAPFDDGRYARLADGDDAVELHAFHDLVEGKRKNRS